MKTLILTLFMGLFVVLNTATAQEKKHTITPKVAKPTVVTSDKPGWHKISERTVSFKTDSDAIAVHGKDNFKALRLRATDAPVHVTNVKVYYENGGMDVLTLNADLNIGEYSRNLSVDPSKELKKVVFMYNSIGNPRNEKGHIELYGMK